MAFDGKRNKRKNQSNKEEAAVGQGNPGRPTVFTNDGLAGLVSLPFGEKRAQQNRRAVTARL
jgi:hypothetical protein